MNPIKALVRNGRIETDEPLNLPEGTELLIAAWLNWYDSLQPLIFTAEEHRALAEDRKARKEWELSNFVMSTERNCGGYGNEATPSRFAIQCSFQILERLPCW